jgi:NADH:ubiquinone oxidoreductase subunit 2 (subunit N)
LLGLGCGTDAALHGSVIYLFVYVLMSAAFLLVFIHARRADYYNLNYTSDFRGLAKKE